MRWLFLVLLLLGCPALRAQTTPPANDRFAKAQVLPGTIGTITGTTVGATAETHESVDAGHTVWYSFTAPFAGYLQIALSPTNAALNPMVVKAWRGSALSTLTQVAGGAGPSSGDSYTPSLYDPQNDFLIVPVPLTTGQKVYLQFDDILQVTDDGLEAAAGTFIFSYQFATGGGFNFTDALTVDDQGVAHYAFRAGVDNTVTATVGRFGSTQGEATVNYQLSSTGFTFSEPASGTLTFAPGVTRQAISVAFPQGFNGYGTLNVRLLQPSDNAAILGNFPLVQVLGSGANAPATDFTNAIAIGATPYAMTLPANTPGPFWFQYAPPADGYITVAVPASAPAIFEGDPSAPLTGISPYTDPQGNTVFALKGGHTYSLSVPIGNQSSPGGMALTFTAGSVFSIATLEPSAYSARASKVASVVVPVVVTRAGDLGAAATVIFATSMGMGGGGEADPDVDLEPSSVMPPTAMANTDFVPLYQTLSFAPGQATVSVPVTIMRHTKNEEDLYFNLHLSQPSQNSVADADATFFTITQDGKPKFFFDDVNGTYSGVLGSSSAVGTGEGFCTLSIATSGVFTFSLRLDGKAYSHIGTLAALAEVQNIATTAYTFTIKRSAPQAALTVTLQEPVSTGFRQYQIAGSVTDGTVSASFTLDRRSSFNAATPNHRAGVYTLSLTPDSNAPAAVQLPGYASLRVSTSNSFRLTGTLPDGTKFAGSGYLAFDSQVNGVGLGDFGNTALFAIPLYSSKGLLNGTLHLSYLGGTAPPAVSGDGDGTLRWVHPALTKGTVLTPFVSELKPFVSHFKMISKEGLFDNAALLPLTLQLTGAGVPPPVAFTLSTASRATVTDGTKGVTLSFSTTTGLFSGSQRITGQPTITLGGAVLQNLGVGTGFANDGASVSILPPM